MSDEQMMDMPEEFQRWITAKVQDQLRARGNLAAAAVAQAVMMGTHFVMMPLGEPPSDPVEREVWEHSCDHCHEEIPRDVGYCSTVPTFWLSDRTRLAVNVYLCWPCANDLGIPRVD